MNILAVKSRVVTLSNGMFRDSQGTGTQPITFDVHERADSDGVTVVLLYGAREYRALLANTAANDLLNAVTVLFALAARPAESMTVFSTSVASLAAPVAMAARPALLEDNAADLRAELARLAALLQTQRLEQTFNAFGAFDMPGGEGWHVVPGLTVELPTAAHGDSNRSVLVTVEYSLAWRGWQYLHAALYADGQIVPFSETLSSDAGLHNAVSKHFTVQLPRTVRTLQVRASGGSTNARALQYMPNQALFWQLTHRRLVVTL